MFNKSSPFPRPMDGREAPRPGTSTTPASSAAPARALVSAPQDTTTHSAPPHPRPQEESSASRLVVGPDVKLKGAEILDCDTLEVEGRVEATMDSRVIRIRETGAFAGKVGIDLAEIHGSFEGELTARRQLIIHATGRVSGTIRYGSILIEEGGQISGDIQAIGAAQTPRPEPLQDKGSPRPTALATAVGAS